MMKKILLIAILALLTQWSYSQDNNYYRAFGVRGGNPLGMTYKQFVGRYSVIEGILGISFSYRDPESKRLGGTITGLYEYHYFLTERLNAYGGGGITIGGGRDLFILNADVILGLDYAVEFFPLNITVDYKPYYSPFNQKLIGTKGFGFNEFGVSVRYIIQ